MSQLTALEMNHEAPQGVDGNFWVPNYDEFNRETKVLLIHVTLWADEQAWRDGHQPLEHKSFTATDVVWDAATLDTFVVDFLLETAFFATAVQSVVTY